MSFPILSAIIFVPLVGGIITATLPRRVAWPVALGIGLIDLALIAAVGAQFGRIGGYQFAEHAPWIPSLGLEYSLGVDGISLFLAILTALLAVIAIASSRGEVPNGQRGGLYFGLMLLLAGGIQGVFLTTNVFLFYVFWEVMLVPAYLLIGTFGGPRRAYAAIKFVIYTAIGSLLMLAGVIGLGAVATASVGHFTLDLPTLVHHVPAGAQGWLFLAFFAAFAVKAPLFPFHSWLPDAYTEAPTPVTVLLAGAMSKTGAYGFIRFCLPLFPNAVRDAAPIIETLAVIGILYCAVQALVQPDFKRLLAYSSISHMGVILLGIFALNAQGLDGAVLQMINHGITTGALFLIAGIIAERTQTRSIRELGGLATRLPMQVLVFCVAALSSLGLPGLNSFAGEFLALLGAFQANVVFGVLGTLVVIPAAWYLLRFFQGVMEGPSPSLSDDGGTTRPRTAVARDLNASDLAVLVPLLALMVLLGFFPGPLPDRIEPSVTTSVLVGQHPAPTTAPLITTHK
ncbi:MAG: NADH-quinone oxidoreductase subunit M [Ktedonobacterales bacterium]|nr:NADH-quinone oxidoreductase subunit M [Ktedonobacterales bacterium]